MIKQISVKLLKAVLLISIAMVLPGVLAAQYSWPVTPLHQSQELTGTFCEYRDTSPAGHYHNGVDIPKADGSPVYAVANGVIERIVGEGSNAYVRVGRFAYVHIRPNPGLREGDYVVAEQTVLGTILSGQGHVHFIDGYYNSEINPIRPGGGLTPYDDPWPPKITSVRFFQDNSELEFQNNRLSGKVDIVVKVEERNGPPHTYNSRLNNGTYFLSYRILSADGESVVYSPVHYFQFDRKPANSTVHNVFFKKYSSTSSHVYIVTNQIVRNDFWDAAQLSPGNYQVMVYTKDTRENADTVYVPVEIVEEDVTPPDAPVLKYVRQTLGGFQLAWYPNIEDDLAGYRLYYSYDNVNWRQLTSAKNIPADSVTMTFSASALSEIYFRLTALDNAPIQNESQPSAVYGIKMRDADAANYLLIVDGFDRTSASGGESHAFGFTYGRSTAEAAFPFDMCSNEAVVDSFVNLASYWAVIWFTGDKGEADKTLSAEEQTLIGSFLNDDGRLFISGANIAWNLDLDSDCYSTTEADNAFLNNVLKADFGGRLALPIAVSGSAGGIFDRIELSLTQDLLAMDSTDVIAVRSPAVSCFEYNSGQVAGLCCENAEGGRLIYFAFPFETIASDQLRTDVMFRALGYLLWINHVPHEDEANAESSLLPKQFQLEQNFPNPLTTSTLIRFHVPESSKIRLKIYNVLGQLVRDFEPRQSLPGIHEWRWNGEDQRGQLLPNGIYFYVLESGNTSFARKLLLIKP